MRIPKLINCIFLCALVFGVLTAALLTIRVTEEKNEVKSEVTQPEEPPIEYGTTATNKRCIVHAKYTDVYRDVKFERRSASVGDTTLHHEAFAYRHLNNASRNIECFFDIGTDEYRLIEYIKQEKLGEATIMEFWFELEESDNGSHCRKVEFVIAFTSYKNETATAVQQHCHQEGDSESKPLNIDIASLLSLATSICLFVYNIKKILSAQANPTDTPAEENNPEPEAQESSEEPSGSKDAEENVQRVTEKPEPTSEANLVVENQTNEAAQPNRLESVAQSSDEEKIQPEREIYDQKIHKLAPFISGFKERIADTRRGGNYFEASRLQTTLAILEKKFFVEMEYLEAMEQWIHSKKDYLMKTGEYQKVSNAGGIASPQYEIAGKDPAEEERIAIQNNQIEFEEEKRLSVFTMN